MLPFYGEQQIDPLCMLTDQGTKYCSAREHHEDEFYVTIEYINHPRTKVESPQINGPVLGWTNASTAPPKRSSTSLLSERRCTIPCTRCKPTWMSGWRTTMRERSYNGRYCFSKTPMQAETDSKELAKEKRLNQLYFKGKKRAVALSAKAGK